MRKKHFTKQVGLILSEETYNRLIEQTNREEVSVSAWIRETIEMHLKSDARINPKNQFPVKRNLGNEKNQIRTE